MTEYCEQTTKLRNEMSGLSKLKIKDSNEIAALESDQDFMQAAISCEAEYHRITTMFSELDRVNDLAVSLEDIASVLEQTEDPITPSEMALVQIAGDIATAGTDVNPDSVIPSVESEDGKAGTIANLKQRVKQLIAAVLAFIKQILARLKNFAVRIAEMYGTMDRRVDVVLNRAKSYKNKDTRVTHVSGVKSLVGFPSNGSSVKDARVISDSKKLLKELNNYFQDIKSLNIGTNIDRVAQLADLVIKVVNSDNRDSVISELRKALNIFTIKQEHAFLGGLILRVDSEQIDGNDITPSELGSFFRNTRVVVEHADSTLIKTVDHQELLSVDDIVSGLEVLREIIKISNTTGANSIQSQLMHTESVLSKIQNNLTHALQQIEKNKDADVVAFNFAKAVIPEFLSFATSASTTGLISVLKNSATIANDMVSVFQKHLACYED